MKKFIMFAVATVMAMNVAQAADGPQNPNDPKSIQAWIGQLRKAAENGESDAQKRFAQCYYKGYGVPKDIVSAYAWYEVYLTAIPNRPTNALYFLTKDMSSKQITEGKKLSRSLHAKVVENMKKMRKDKLSELLVNKTIVWKDNGWTHFFPNGRFQEDDGYGTYTFRGNTLTLKWPRKTRNFTFPAGNVSAGSTVKCNENGATLTIKSIKNTR